MGPGVSEVEALGAGAGGFGGLRAAMFQVVLVDDGHGVFEARFAAQLPRRVDDGAESVLLQGGHLLVVDVL